MSLDSEALAELESKFEPSSGGTFMQRFGAAGPQSAFSQKKVCFVATDRGFLVSFIYRLSLSRECHWVKYSREPRDGMYLARCFMTSDDAAGRLCMRCKAEPKLMVSLQDDDFIARFR